MNRDVLIQKSIAKGSVVAPPSKSMAHRMLICAALAKGSSTIRNIAYSQDILATIDALQALGAVCETEGDTVKVTGVDPFAVQGNIAAHCRESGSTLRFMIPIFLLSGAKVALTGQGRLMQRPQTVYEQICKEKGMFFAHNDREISLQGPLKPGVYQLAGDVSSQFVSGMLFALPLLSGDSYLKLIPPVESRSYIDMTLQAMRIFGIEVDFTDEYTIRIPGNQTYRSTEATVEGDYSNAAFLEALNVLGGDVRVEGLLEESKQGDRVYKAYFDALCHKKPVDISDCPDLGPILMAVAAAKGGGMLTGTARLQFKESDRGEVMAEELGKMGLVCEVEKNRIVVSGKLRAPKEPLYGHNDHRIVMSLAVLATLTGGKIIGAQAVQKSYPDFFERIEELGIGVSCIDRT
jgi:3-phosphoshikimate 1-carboxyvinyltransferase